MEKIGIIGLGDMGKLYARELANRGYEVYGCDIPEKYKTLKKELKEINVLRNGIEVSRRADFIIYSVETEKIEEAVKAYGPSTKVNAIVAGFTSVKTPEINAFEKYLPRDVSIITCHPMHGPSIKPKNQTIILINHSGDKEQFKKVKNIFRSLEAKIVEMPDFKEHDRITADTQAVTHMGFESMGTAWKNAGFYPWENPSYTGGIDNVKILMALRIFSGKPHVYAGLAILNPYAREQVSQYAKSVEELFGLMIQEKERKFRERIEKARDFVFGKNKKEILLDDKTMGEFSLGNIPSQERKPNSHLSLLAMVDAWYKLKINPYANLICQTPPFRLRLGIAEYLFKNDELLEESIKTALYDKSIRYDDLKFVAAVTEWASIVKRKDITGYKQLFNETKEFFKDRLEEAKKKSDELIKKLS